MLSVIARARYDELSIMTEQTHLVTPLEYKIIIPWHLWNQLS